MPPLLADKGVRSGAAIWNVGSLGSTCDYGFEKEAAVISVPIFLILNVFEGSLPAATDEVFNAR